MKKADRPKTVFPGSLATPSLLSGINMLIPCSNWLEKTFKDVDVNLLRGTFGTLAGKDLGTICKFPI